MKVKKSMIIYLPFVGNLGLRKNILANVIPPFASTSHTTESCIHLKKSKLNMNRKSEMDDFIYKLKNISIGIAVQPEM